jgi:putative Mg2+ transporter-C (MgtC) family protein
MAGTRTNALVSAGAAAFAMVGVALTGDTSGAGRIAGQIVSGVGFLGAGVIFKEGANIRGLNTAATVWCSAAVGTLSGMGYPQFSVIMAAAVLLTNVSLRPLAYKLHPNPGPQDYRLRMTCRRQEEAPVRALLLASVRHCSLVLNALNIETLASSEEVRISAEVRSSCRDEEGLEQLVTRMSLEPGVSAVSWRAISNGSVAGAEAEDPGRPADALRRQALPVRRGYLPDTSL